MERLQGVGAGDGGVVGHEAGDLTGDGAEVIDDQNIVVRLVGPGDGGDGQLVGGGGGQEDAVSAPLIVEGSAAGGGDVEGGGGSDDIGAAERLFHDEGRCEDVEKSGVAEGRAGGVGDEDTVGGFVGGLDVGESEGLVGGAGDGGIEEAPLVTDGGRAFDAGIKGGAFSGRDEGVL